MDNKHMAFAEVWTKYLPAIRILLKKALATEQLLGMNRSDFDRAAGIKKSGYRFHVPFLNGKPDGLFSNNSIAQGLISALVADRAAQALITENDYLFSFNTKYQLQIKYNGINKQVSTPVTEEELAAN